MAAHSSSLSSAVAAARSAVEDRLRQSRVELVLEALKTDAELEAMCLGDLVGSEDGAAPWKVASQGQCVSADECLAHGEPIYVFPPDLRPQPSTTAPSSEPAFVGPWGYAVGGAAALEPPPGLEPMLAWQLEDHMAVQFSCYAPAAVRRSSADQNEGAKAQPRRRRRCQLLLATHLKEMEGEDTSCIIHVRQIHRLGFNSTDLLREYCSNFGPVKRIALSNAHEKLEETPGLPFPVRVRPSGIGFVVMERPEDAAAVIAQGEVQTINGCAIKVRKFEAREEKACQEVEDTSVASTCPPSPADGFADAALSISSYESEHKREHLGSEDTTISTSLPSASNSTTDEIMSDVASLGAFNEEDQRSS